MAETKKLTGTIQIRRGTAAEWEGANPVLAAGELGYDTTNKVVKIGDGTTAWNALGELGLGGDMKEKINETWAIAKELKVALLSLSTCSPAQIKAISESGLAPEVFAVGDETTITLTSGEQVTLVIADFNHDDLTAGGKAGITFNFKGILQTTYQMNTTNTNVGGYTGTHMYNTTLPAIYDLLPDEWKAIIKPVNKKTSAGNQSTEIETTSEKIFLLSRVEVDGATSATYVEEGEQYEYYKTAANRVKRYPNGTAGVWWLRSPNVANTTSFCSVLTTGALRGGGASGSFGVAVGFCV